MELCHLGHILVSLAQCEEHTPVGNLLKMEENREIAQNQISGTLPVWANLTKLTSMYVGLTEPKFDHSPKGWTREGS